MKRIWPLAFLVLVVGLTAAILGDAGGEGDRASTDRQSSTTATVILDLSPSALPQSPPSGSESTTSPSGVTETTSAEEQATSSTQAVLEEKGADAAVSADDSSEDSSSGENEGEPPGTYTVKSGDTPHSIAQSLGITADELMRLNGIEDPTGLQIGDVLQVPSP